VTQDQAVPKVSAEGHTTATSGAHEYDPTDWVPVKEACAYGRWSRPTFNKLRKAGKIASLKDGWRRFASKRSIDRYKLSLVEGGSPGGKSGLKRDAATR